MDKGVLFLLTLLFVSFGLVLFWEWVISVVAGLFGIEMTVGHGVLIVMLTRFTANLFKK